MKQSWDLFVILSLFRRNESANRSSVTVECIQSQIHMRSFYGPLIGVSLIYTFIISLQTKRRSCCRPRPNQRAPHSAPGAVTTGNSSTDASPSQCKQCSTYCSLYPGLPLPMNSMFYRHSTLAYAAGYLCAFNIIAAIFTEYYGVKRAIPDAPTWFGMLYRVIAIALLTTTLLPVFISITRGGFFCWSCGALYSLLQAVLLLTSFGRATCLGFQWAMRQATLQFPTLVGFLYLTFYFCQQLVVHRKELTSDWLQFRLNKPSAYVTNAANYVRYRLRPVSVSQEDTEPKKSKKSPCCVNLCRGFRRLYRPPVGFTYPPILIWSLTVSVLLQYFLVNQSLTWFYHITRNGQYSISQRYPDIHKTIDQNLAISNARHVYTLFQKPSNTSKDDVVKLQYEFVYYWIDIFWVCIVSATFLALFSNSINVLRILLNYQTLSFEIYRKGYSAVPAVKRLLDPFKVTRGNILFPSYQIALMVCGFYLQVLIYGFIFMFLAVVVTMNAFTKHAFLVHFFRTTWPNIVLLTIFATVQQLAIRFLFTERRGKSYGFNHTRSLQVYAFFASFYNVIFGLISGVGRILYCPISSAICISRLDISPLGIPLQSMDTSYMAFLGFLYADTMTHNPIKKAFLWILLHPRRVDYHDDANFDSALLVEVECFHKWLNRPLSVSSQSCKKTKPGPWGTDENMYLSSRDHTTTIDEKNESDSERAQSNPRARNRWFLAYSLVRNPVLQKWRKSALTTTNTQGVHDLSNV